MQRTHPEEIVALPRPLRTFLVVSLACMALSFAVATWVWHRGLGELGGMWMSWDDRFTDLSHYDGVFPYFHQASFFTGAERFAYPAPAAVIYAALLHLQPYRLATFFIFTALLVVVSGLLFGRRLLAEGLSPRLACLFVAGTVLGSWPLLFLYERANIESLLICLTFLGALAFWRGRPVSAGFLWGLAAAVKIYPLLLLALFLYRDRLRAFWVGLTTCLATLLLSFWFVGPTIALALKGTLEGISGFVGTYAGRSRPAELRYDHSFLAFLKTPLTINRLHLSTDVSRLSHAYLLVAGLAIVVLYFTRFRRLPTLNQYILVTVAMVTVPPVSYDYTLMHLYPAFALLVLLLLRSVREGVELPALRRLLLCFAAVFASENFVFLHGFHMNGMIKAAAMFVACVLLFRNPLPSIQEGGDAADESTGRGLWTTGERSALS